MNSQEHVNAITLRSGKQLEDNHLGKSEKNDENMGNNEQEDKKDHVSNEFDIPSSHVSHKNVTNSIPLSNRLKQSNKEKKFEKFTQVFKQIRINFLLLILSYKFSVMPKFS